MQTNLTDLPENTPVVITTFKGSSFVATYRKYIPLAQRYEFGICIGSDTETTVLFDKANIESYKLAKEPISNTVE